MSDDDPRVHPHGSLRELAPGLLVVEGRFGLSPMGRRMSVVACEAGLLLHSPMWLKEEQRSQLEALGKVRWILAPNRFHASEAPVLARHHEGARVLVPQLERARLESKGLRVDGTVEADWPEELKGVLEAHPVRGLRIGETALHHVPSRSLILNDLCMNFSSESTRGLHRMVMRLNGVLDRLAPSRVLRLLAKRDSRELAASLAPVLQLELDRIVVSHGEVFLGDGRQALRRAFESLSGEQCSGGGKGS